MRPKGGVRLHPRDPLSARKGGRQTFQAAAGGRARFAWSAARIAGVQLHPPSAERAPKLLTREEVCKILGITPRALYTRIRRGKFPRPTFGVGKRSLWREEDVVRGHE